PLLSVYLAMAAKLPITSRDILHQAELWQGIQLVRDVIAVAADPHVPLADKMELYEKSAGMTEADHRRLGEMIAVVKRRQTAQALEPAALSRAIAPFVASTIVTPDVEVAPAAERQSDAEPEPEVDLVPMTRYSARRVMERVEATR